MTSERPLLTDDDLSMFSSCDTTREATAEPTESRSTERRYPSRIRIPPVRYRESATF